VVPVGTKSAATALMNVRAVALASAVALVVACQDPVVVARKSCVSGLSFHKMKLTKIDKLDLLLVVDNSKGMADKQSELARRVPELLAALVAPDAKGRASLIHDVHVGVITSSLGSFGTSACAIGRQSNDRAHLLPRVDGTCATTAASPLSWTSGDLGPLQSTTACVVTAARERGCMHESTWEAAYHFLADPAPYAKAEVKCTFTGAGDACGNNKIVVEGIDEEVLAQRKAFLRSDSVLAVLVVSDENDASLKPAGLNWLPWGYGAGRMLPGWGACANVPDEFEPETPADFSKLHDVYKCFSCFEDASDPHCKQKWPADPLDADIDALNLRAFRQTQRFGYSFLWGRQRYVDAFTKWSVLGSDNKLAGNGVFVGFRDANLVLVGALTGVSRHLVEEDDGTAKRLTDADWERIVGPVGKRDPHMIESIAPREGIAGFAGDRMIDPINGGDRHVPEGDDLQYACIASRAEATKSADCAAADAHLKNPICSAGGIQAYAKAYPGLRHLRIVRDLGASGFVASLCRDSYTAAMAGFADRIRLVFDGQKCLRSALEADPRTGAVACRIFESLPDGFDGGRTCEQIAGGLCTPGAAPCARKPVSPGEAAPGLYLPITTIGADGVARSSAATPIAEGPNVYALGADGRKHLVCELQQLEGEALQACRLHKDFTLDPAVAGGFCYSTNDEIIGEQCKRLGTTGTVRLLGGADPPDGAELFPYCGDSTCW